jgi:hypothetical protein
VHGKRLGQGVPDAQRVIEVDVLLSTFVIWLFPDVYGEQTIAEMGR